MAHCAKYTKGAMGHLMKHYERGKDENGEYIKFGNESIDTSCSHLNYNLATHQQSQLDFIHKRLSEVHCLKRKDVNVMCSWVITAPKELPQEHTREFFQRSYDFLEKKYGKENVISSYVHLDETTPHMHFAFVPVVYDKKKDKYKVSAKEVLTKAELKRFHTDLQAEMDKFVEKYEHEFECNVLNGATANGNRTIQEFKAELYEQLADDEREQVSQLMALTGEELSTLEELKEEAAELKRELGELKELKKSLRGECEKYSEGIKKLSEDFYELKSKEASILSAFLKKDEIRGEFERFKGRYMQNLEREKEIDKNKASLFDKKASKFDDKPKSFDDRPNAFNSFLKQKKAKNNDFER